MFASADAGIRKRDAIGRALPWLCALSTAFACETHPNDANGPKQEPSVQVSPLETTTLQAFNKTYAEIAYAAYSDAVDGAKQLQSAVDALVDAPSDSTLVQARKAWLIARHPYQRSEVFRFYDGPIDRVEMRLNTWPIDEGFVDGNASTAGIVGDFERYPALSTSLLVGLNAAQGETSISTGYHVIEYLLWGADKRNDGAGERPFSDFKGPTGSLQQRRGAYLKLAVQQLLSDLQSVQVEWAPGSAQNYRATFSNLPPRDALALAVKGMGALSGPELGGERLTVAYETKAQENEHSCFSDNTTVDLLDDALGIEGVCTGRYARADVEVIHGTGLCDALAASDPELAAALRKSTGESVAAIRSIPAPFDQAILGADSTPGRSAIGRSIRALEQQAELLSRVAAIFGLRVASVKGGS
jgi:putative iron-regulated protein